MPKWLALLVTATALRGGGSIALTPLGAYTHSGGGAAKAEIAAYDPATERLFSTNAANSWVEALDLSNPATPALAFTIPVGGVPNSVAIRDGVVAVAVEASPRTDPGKVKFYTTGGSFLSEVTVGSVPDMLLFTPNGRRVLVANEGEPNSYIIAGSIDPVGSVSIIDMTGGAASLTNANVTTATFSAAIPTTNPLSIRVYGPGATLAQDMEPEYITVSHDSKTAWVTLQENNAIGILDIEAGVFTQLAGLNFKNHNLAPNKLDPSDRDNPPTFLTGAINIGNWRAYGMYQPDGIDSYRVGGDTYLVMANEGDARDYPGFTEEVRVGSGSYVLDATAFPDGATLKMNQNLGRLTVTNQTGDTDGDGDFDRIVAFGARSFSIRNANGDLVFDSGDAFEQITAAMVPGIFNSNGTAGTFDTRSDNKGPEPEGVVVGKAFGRDYAFIGLERVGGVMVWDVSDPNAPSFVQYISTAPAHQSPEGILFIKEDDSPNGKALVVTSNEVSGTTRIFQVNKAP